MRNGVPRSPTFGIRHSAFRIPHSMDYLWSPWRLPYVTGTAKSAGCVFCEAQAGPQQSLIVFRGNTSFVILNLYPYNNGHLMVVPKRHIGTLTAATSDELCELMEL